MANPKPTEHREEIQFRQLLDEAVTKPGTLMQAYSLFWNYSLGNQLLAMWQAHQRGLTVGPIASYTKWRELGRQVRRGEKAIVLCRPVTGKRTDTDNEGNETESVYTRFVFKPFWFFVSQTDGAEYQAPAPPTWNRERALKALNVTEIPFDMMDGNCQGYAKDRSIAINPLAAIPVKTTFHELAHVELGHTTEAVHDSESLPRNLREVEAESVAMLCLEALGLDGADYCRGYIQAWSHEAINEKCAHRIFAAADHILKAGIEKQEVPQ